MKIENRQPKIAIVIAASFAIGLLVFSPMTIFPNVNAITTLGINSADQANYETLQKYMPTPLSQADSDKALQIALSDGNVKSKIGGKHVTLMAQGFTGNLKTNPGVWYPTLTLNVNNETEVVVVVDLSQNKATQISDGPPPAKDPLLNWNTERAWSIDYYTGSKTITGISFSPSTPTYTRNSAHNFTAYLVNGVMSGSVDGDLCNNSKTDAYWTQVGYDYYTNSTAAKLIWTDTYHNCFGVGTGIAYNTAHSYSFYTWTSSSLGKWYVEALDNTSGSTYTATISGPSSYTMQTSDHNTSVFFENGNTITSWSGDFSGSVYATASILNSGSWINWDNDAHVNDQDCGTTHTDTTVISGNLKSANTATWNLSVFANNFPAKPTC